MPNSLIERLIRQQENRTGESADFLRDIWDASPGAFLRFAGFVPMSRFRGHLPVNAVAAARIATVHEEDCGPCLQTVVTMSLDAGASPHILAAAVEERLDEMDEETALVFRFAKAIVTRDPKVENDRAAIEQRWGKAGLTELALAIASTRVFPTLKRVMGYAEACQRITIAGKKTEAALPLRGTASGGNPA